VGDSSSFKTDAFVALLPNSLFPQKDGKGQRDKGRTMEGLSEILQSCTRDTLKGALERLCAIVRDDYDPDFGLSRVIEVLAKVNARQQLQRQRAQEKDKASFLVALGRAAVSRAAQHETCTSGLQKLGMDLLRVVHEFLAWNTEGRNSWVAHGRPVVHCSWSPDGTQILSCSADSTVKVWDTNGNVRHTLKHTRLVKRCFFSPGGETILSCSWDKTIKLWDSITGECKKTLRGHLEWINDACFSKDGNVILSCSSDGMIGLMSGRDGGSQSLL
jgi:WD40 repeat protein